MKNLRFIVIMTLMAVCALSAKADKYSDGLKELLTSGVISSFDIDKLQKMNPQGSSLSNESSMALLADYLAPFYRQNMSEENFDKLLAYYKSPEIETLTKKLINGIGEIDMQKILQPAMMTIMQGGTPDPIKLDTCSQEKLAKVKKCVEISGTEEQLKQAIAGISSVIQEQTSNLPAEQLSMVKKMMDGAFGYLGSSVSTLVSNILIKTMSESDLDTLNDIEKQPFFKEMQATDEAILADIPNMMRNMLSKIKEQAK